MSPYDLDPSITQGPEPRKLSHIESGPPGSDFDRQVHDPPRPLPLANAPLGLNWVPRRGYSTQSTTREGCEDLDEYKLLEAEVEQRSRKALVGWKLTSHSIEQLTTLPEKIDHPGAERYIGSELKGYPKYLWDSSTGTTVLATNDMYNEGYVAVSYTWGRWRLGSDNWYWVKGTPWEVPSLTDWNPDFPDLKCHLNMAQLTDILRRMPNVRYFWIDVLCIPQKKSSPEMANVKAIEIAKQGAIFKNARSVLVYLWSIDDGAQFAATMKELSAMMRWYWQIMVSQDFQATTKHNGRKRCDDSSGPRLREDPWFSSLWTLQEMILAPASVWIARDGSHCRLNNNEVLTTHTVADKFHDFPVREAYYDSLGCMSLDPSRDYVQSNIPPSENKSREVMRRWLKWAFQTASITTCVVESRGGMVLATLERKYSQRREMAVLAALKVGNDKGYDKQSETVNGLAIDLWNTLIQAEGGRLFDVSHTSSSLLTNMLPSPSRHVSQFRGIRATCDGWELRGNGELKVARGSKINQPSREGGTEYRFHNRKTFGGSPEGTVRKHIWESSGKKIEVRHVRFILIGNDGSINPFNESKFAGALGVILVTTSNDIHSMDCLWYKAGMYYSTDYETELLDHDIIVGA
ncbi:hypothetical protein EPUS_09340 [Endocarpon pusillum Z07020]|uniref:Heterokaryon incompatibility domain-containing protein n=1 Tax=Endocarpon pusillum (strain Z07020 / HMAS-L-300199) TaxID=1263415 RepID=U1FZF6_ENDPU|nr:uncharacterized protein EPUS_09340 [Endocarpon pusillum Z07020]ERF70322.1 hypothetical protein EPUS_09340 [Endocarpon pusillum Z07020]